MGNGEETTIRSFSLILRGVKDWVHMKTAKMMQDFNYFCNVDVNHKLLLIFIMDWTHENVRNKLINHRK